MKIANRPIDIVVPSISTVYPQHIAKGQPIPTEVLDLCVLEGWADDAPEAEPSADSPAPPIDSGLPPVPAAVMAATVAAAVSASQQSPQPVTTNAAPSRRARLKVGITIDIDGLQVKFAKGAIVEDDLADQMIAAGKAVAIAAHGTAPETK